MKIIINGRVLLRGITGIERYARETLAAMDSKIKPHEYIIAIPYAANVTNMPQFKNFEILKIEGYENGFLWEQISLLKFAKKNKCIVVNFDYSTPILQPGISTIHDMSFKTNRSFFSENFSQKIVRKKLEIYCKSLARSNNIIFTVTEFQKKEITKYYHVDGDRIVVAGNAWQHFNRINEDNSVLGENGLHKGKFFFSLSSNTKNKNFKWVYDVAKRNQDSLFVIAGGRTSISSDELKNEKNILYLGYQSDERIKSLYRNCRAFIFPSLYEGFGIPPMEALSVGSPIIIARASCLPEIYGECAYYIDPYDSNVDLELILSSKSPLDSNYVLDKYSWERTADIWLERLRKL